MFETKDLASLVVQQRKILSRFNPKINMEESTLSTPSEEECTLESVLGSGFESDQ